MSTAAPAAGAPLGDALATSDAQAALAPQPHPAPRPETLAGAAADLHATFPRAAESAPVDGGRDAQLELDQLRLASVAQQAAAVRWQIVATALVVAVLAWQAAPALVVEAWLVAVVGVREWRAAALRALVDNRPPRPLALRLDRLVLWNVAIGVVNGAAALFMLWLDATYDALLTMILVSWAAGAVSTSAPMLRAYKVYSIGVFAPLVAMWLAQASWLGLGVAALIAMFARVQYRFARQNADVFEASFRIRFENQGLLRQLGEARDVAEAANRAKTRFLAAASHDLRQPLHALTLHSGLLAQDPATPDARAIALDIAGSIDSLARLLDSLLDISKLDAGVVEVERRPLGLQRLVQHLVATHAPQARAKGLALHGACPAEAVIDSDPVLLERLLRNLLDNALKYTDAGEVAIEVAADAGRWRITVRDSGRGIAPQLQARVFDEFYQVDPGSPGAGSAGGLGLGLSIVRRLSGLLAIPVELESEPGRGTLVTLRLAQAERPVAEPAPAPAQAALLGLNVLVIDDEEPVRRAMHGALQRFGCDSIEVADADAALACLQRFQPDLVLSDFQLPRGATGIDAIARLRERLPGLPALLISGDTDAERLRQAQRSGLALLHKPVTLAQLHAAIVELLA